MIVAAWNYTPDPTVSPVCRAVQCHVNFDTLEPEFFVDGKLATPRQASVVLRKVPVLTWAHPFHQQTYPQFGGPFSERSIADTRQMVATAYKRLRKAGGLFGSAAWLDTVRHVTDFEGFNDYSKPPVKADAPFAVVTDHASTACHLFGQALRMAGFDGPAANYGTCHGPVCPALGGGNNRATPAHVPGGMDARTTFLTGYTSGGPDGCLQAQELESSFDDAPHPAWLAIDDYQPGRESIIRNAYESGVALLLLWGTEKDSVPGIGNNRRPIPDAAMANVALTLKAKVNAEERAAKEWSREQDKAIAGELAAATFKGTG